MTAIPFLKSAPQDGLHPMDSARHLNGVADLIELCFAHDMDAGGRGFLREMHFLSHFGAILPLADALGLITQPWRHGYVWLKAGQVVGCVSAHPAAVNSTVWLIANMAVHPNHRRQGIARAMLQAALDFIFAQGGIGVILQVDDDNLGAIALYRQLGFTRVTTQTAWTRPALAPLPAPQPSAFEIRKRHRREWAAQLALAQQVRPEGLFWNRPLAADDFQAGLWLSLDRFLGGRVEEHWVIDKTGGGLAGSLTLRVNWADGDRLILLVHPDYRGQLERPLLLFGVRRLGERPWATHIEHSADDEPADAALRALGFEPRRTLRWMKKEMR